MKPNLCHVLGIAHPIIAAPMGPDLNRCDGFAGGPGRGLVRAIKPAGQLVHELVEEARQIISRRLLGLIQPA
jgi:hypothetical protein